MHNCLWLQLAFNSHRLDQLKVTVKGQDSATIHQLINDPHKTILLSSIPVDTSVTSASAVVGRNGSSQLIHVGDSVKFYAHPTEVLYKKVLLLSNCIYYVP